jgi:hypothetical protein
MAARLSIAANFLHAKPYNISMRKIFQKYDQLPGHTRFVTFMALMLLAVGIIPTIVCIIKHDIKWFNLVQLTSVAALLIPRMLYIHAKPQRTPIKGQMPRDIEKIGGC